MRWRLGPLTDRLKKLLAVDDAANSGGSSYFSGWYTYVAKNLTGGFATGRYCGANAEDCRSALWAALDAAGRQLVLKQGPDPALWRADARPERITFGFLPDTMAWTNRPTFQQVITFSGHRRR
jgi:hypothetical protein